MSAELKQRYQQAIDALNRSDWRSAQVLGMGLLRELPEHAGVHFIVGVAAKEQRQIPQALSHLDAAVRLNPSRADYLSQLASTWMLANMPVQAVAFADRAASIAAPDDAITRDTLGLVFTQAHAYDRAAEMFGKVSDLLPASARAQFNHATALIHGGKLMDAEQALERCLAADASYWRAYLSRSALRKWRREDNHVGDMLQRLSISGHDPMAALCLNLALSKEYEDLGEDASAFAHLVEGKRWGGKGRRYATAKDAEVFASLMASAPRDVLPSVGCDSEAPIFVVGLPRTGTTLVERIVSSHPDVISAGELQSFGIALKRASGSRTPSLLDLDTIARSRNLDWRALGKGYIASTPFASGGAQRFIDKLPHNFLYVAYIAAALPNARIICLRRNPMDSCLSNFRQLFAIDSPYYDYSFDMMDTARYYVLFDTMMKHWRLLLPGRVLEVQYESIVDDLESNARRLLEFCGLPWDDACMRFDENKAPVATASAIQVRSPVYRSALGRWKRFESELRPVRDLLESAGIEVRG